MCVWPMGKQYKAVGACLCLEDFADFGALPC